MSGVIIFHRAIDMETKHNSVVLDQIEEVEKEERRTSYLWVKLTVPCLHFPYFA